MNSINRYSLPLAHFLGRQDFESSSSETNNAQSFCLEQEMYSVFCLEIMISVFSDTSSVRVGLVLPLADNNLQVHITMGHHTGICRADF